jgi:cytidine deaminase
MRCPRQPDEGYLPCVNVCRQPFHAEVAAIMKAMDDDTDVREGRMTIWHHRVCEHCRDVMNRYNITWELR